MTTDPAVTIARLTRLVLDADAACDRTEDELAAAMKDLDAAHAREAALGAELIAAQKIIDEQAQFIAVQQHAAVLAYEEQLRLSAEIKRLHDERLRAVAMCTVVVSVPRVTGGPN